MDSICDGHYLPFQYNKSHNTKVRVVVVEKDFLFSFLQDYVDVESPEIVVKDEAEYHEAKSPESPCVDTFTKAPE